MSMDSLDQKARNQKLSINQGAGLQAVISEGGLAFFFEMMVAIEIG